MFLEVDKLSSHVLKLMIHENIYACRIKNFFDRDACFNFSQRIGSFIDKERYEINKSISKIGSAIFDYAFDNNVSEYFDLVDKNNRNIKSIFGDCPPSKFAFEELNNAWKHGCEVENFYKKKAYYGIVRLFEYGGVAPPHQDMTTWDIKDCEEAKTIKKQFSVNIYLQVAHKGGDLAIYDKQINNEEIYQKTFLRYLEIGFEDAHKEIIDNDKVKFVFLKPEVGEL